MVKKILIIIGLNFIYFLNFVFADSTTDSPIHLVSGGLPDKKIGSGAGRELLKRAIEEAVQIAVILSVFAIIFSGIYYLTSSGNEEKTKKARNRITWSLIGVFISATAWGIVNWLNNININF